MPYGLRGMGTTQQDAIDANRAVASYCSGWVGYIDPACWGYGTFSSAARDAIYGDKYPAPPAPPTVGSTLPGGAPIPAVPPDAASPDQVAVGAGQIVGSITGQQASDWQAQNQTFFESLNESLNPPDGTGTNWWLWVGLGAGVLLLGSAAAGGGSPSRYGR